MTPDLIGRKLSHYEILSLLGAGGMGEVYLARDTQLGRKAALKILAAHVAQDQERMQRFVREAKAASALNHPNVATIYEIGEDGGVRFIAMEYVEGQTLAARIADRALDFGEIVDIGIQAADALDAAHANGITHRDIKSDNIMVRPDGLVKILDFGLAKLTETGLTADAGDAPTIAPSATRAGVVIGTLNYMSPEQARGQNVDARTDIFSLGVTLYEMIARRTPFEGDTPSDVLVSILSKDPPPLTQYVSSVPAELERIVTKALRKNREERYQAVKDLRNDLKDLRQELRPVPKRASVGTSGAASPVSTSSSAEYLVDQVKRHKRGAFVVLAALIMAAGGIVYFTMGGEAIESVAVLPFTNAATNPETEYLANGITESIISNLSQLPQLKVMSRSSVFRYKGLEVDPQTAGRELQVQAVLTGRVVPHDDELVISLELIDVRDNTQLWGEQYSQKLADLLQVQTDISRQVSEKLRLRLSGAQQQLAKKPTDDAEAYQLYLKGRFFWTKFTEEDSRQAISYFQQAIERDPQYAMAYVGLADAYISLGADLLSPREAMPKAKGYATEALRLDPSLAEAHASMGIIKLVYDWDWTGAESELHNNLPLSPQSVEVFSCALHYADPIGRSEETIAEMRRALKVDPLSLATNLELGCASYYGRQYDGAIAQFHQTLSMYPNNPGAYFGIGRAYGQKKMYPEAIAELSKGRTTSGDWPPIVAELAYAYAASGKKAEARKLLLELNEQATHRFVDPYLIAMVYVGLDEKDQTFDWLEKAYDERSGYMPWLKVEPKWDSIRQDPRFANMLGRVGLTL